MNFEMIQYYTFPLYAMNSAQYSIVLEYETKNDMKQKSTFRAGFKIKRSFHCSYASRMEKFMLL